jgi:Rieske 2Fe-2S family protein
MHAAPAPIDQAALEPVTAPLGKACTLPAAAYLSDEVFAWEREWLFARTWVCLGRGADLLGPGQVRAVGAAGESILLTRDGAIAAFSNVCRHRGHELVELGPARDLRLIRCPYHSWTYTLEGSLRSAPVVTHSPDFDRADYPLVPIRIAEWHGFLWANLSGDALELVEHLGNLGDELSGYQLHELVRAAHHEYLIEANWKVVVENYSECYHCSSIHPDLCRISPPESGRDLDSTGMWFGGPMDLREGAETMSMDGRSAGMPIPGLAAARLRQVLYVALFPNLLVSAHPDYVMTHRLEPLAPDGTRIVCEWLFPREAVDRTGFDPSYAVDFWDLTNRQDWAVCEGVQRGMRHRGYRQGILSTWEGTVYQFNQIIAGAYAGKGLQVPVRPQVSKRPTELLP